MRFLGRMLGHTPKPVVTHPAPPKEAVTPTEQTQLRRATARIEKKWHAFDALVADYDRGDGFLHGRRPS